MSVDSYDRNIYRMRGLRPWGSCQRGAIRACKASEATALFDTGFWEFLPFAAKPERR